MNAATVARVAGALGADLAAQLGGPNLLAADGAVPVVGGLYSITKAGVCALTIAAPAAADVGTVIQITSTTANAHTLTFTGNTLRGGTAAVALATLAAQKGAGLTIACVVAGEWNVLSNVAATLS